MLLTIDLWVRGPADPISPPNCAALLARDSAPPVHSRPRRAQTRAWQEKIRDGVSGQGGGWAFPLRSRGAAVRPSPGFATRQKGSEGVPGEPPRQTGTQG